MSRGLLWLAAAILLAGCSRAPPGTLEYQDGYTAGCYDGRFDANAPTTQTTWIRDESMFGTNTDYKAGWQEAYVKCYTEELEHPIMGTIGR